MESFIQDIYCLFSTWEFWKWFLSTAITVGSIFGAAYWAQGLFNRNALNREDRDRRLNALIEINEITMDIKSTIVNIGENIDKLRINYNDTNRKFRHMRSLNSLHDLKIDRGLEGLWLGLVKFKDVIDTLHPTLGGVDDAVIWRKKCVPLKEMISIDILPTMDVISDVVVTRFVIIKKN